MTIELKLIILFGIVVIAFGSGWRMNGNRYEEQIAQMRQEAEEAARAAERKTFEKLMKAENEATEREQKIRADAVNVRNAVDRLRQQLAMYAADNTGAISLQRTGVVAELFADCAGKYRDMAETADRLDNDRRKLRDAWPAR